MDMKRCCTCKQHKPFSEFHRDRSKSDGYQARCKECCCASQRKYRHSAKGRESRHKYRHSPNGLESLHKYNQSPWGRRSRQRLWQKYAKSPKGREARRKQTARHREKHPERIKAINFLNNAVQRGKIQRPEKCVICGKRGRVDGHHHKGYAEDHYLDVLWLCPKCHAQVHREEAHKTGKDV